MKLKQVLKITTTVSSGQSYETEFLMPTLSTLKITIYLLEE